MDVNSTSLVLNNIAFTPECLTAFATIILVATTIVYVFFAGKLTQETVKLREVETTPFMSIYIKLDSKLSLIVENIGKAPAYDIEFKMDKKYTSCFPCGCDFKHKISYFSPNQQLPICMDQYSNLEKLDFDSIHIEVKYSSKDGQLFEEIFTIEWKYLSGSALETDNLVEIKKAIEETAKEIKELHKTIKDKEYFVTNKLKILEFVKTDTDISFVFSNGFIMKIPINEFNEKIGIISIEKVRTNKGDLCDYSTRLTYTAEEIYDKLENINHEGNK